MEITQEECFVVFFNNPCPNNAYKLILSCKNYITHISWTWREPNLSKTDKIKELISEMLLILLEDIDLKKVKHINSMMMYIHQRLKRIIFPKGKEIIGLSEQQIINIKNTGRSNFSVEKLEQANILYEKTRNAMLSEQNTDNAILYFLFIHVFPETLWASRQLASKQNVEINSRIETDRKRIYRFNCKLRNNLESIQGFDWKGIMEWSRGERSHLAWRIISISPNEISEKYHNDLQTINNWRENINKDDIYSPKNMKAAENIVISMKNIKFANFMPCEAQEEIEHWGKPPDILGMLVGNPEGSFNVSHLEEFNNNSSFEKSISDEEYKQIASELTDWFKDLLNAKSDSKSNNISPT